MHSRPWLWPNLLSLDAPVVALLWQLLFVRCFHGSLGTLPAALLAIAVWLIYVADRTLDAWRGLTEQPRHEFYGRHWRAVLPIWIAALGGGAWLAWSRLPRPLFVEGAVVASGTALYLAAVHLTPGLLRRAGSKESAVAVLFGLGASLAAWPGVQTTSDVLAILLFSCLCWMNCAAIDDWEHGHELRPSVIAAAGLVALIAACLLQHHRPVLGGAETAGALGLVVLDRLRGRYSPEALRVLADVVLLTPIVFLPAAGMFGMNCDLIAPHYWWIERLGMGRALERRRRWFLPEIGNARRALVLGDGDGRFLRELLRRNQMVRADYVDLSRRMLELAQHKAGAGRVDYKQADALTVEFPQDEYDLIATHFFFDCFGPNELELLIGRVADAAKPGARWIVSEFRTPNIPARLLVSALYRFFGITTGLKTRKLADHRPIMRTHGFRLINASYSRGALVVSELWER